MPQFNITLADVNRMSRSERRKMYTRLRHQALDRLADLEDYRERGYKIANKEYGAGYKMTDAELKSKLVDVTKFLDNPLSFSANLAKYEQEQVAKLNRHGIPVTLEDFPKFQDFMEKYRTANYEKLFDSKQTAQVWRNFKKYKVTHKDIAEHQKEFEKRNLTMQQAIVLTAKRKQKPTPDKAFRRKLGIR